MKTTMLKLAAVLVIASTFAHSAVAQNGQSQSSEPITFVVANGELVIGYKSGMFAASNFIVLKKVPAGIQVAVQTTDSKELDLAEAMIEALRQNLKNGLDRISNGKPGTLMVSTGYRSAATAAQLEQTLNEVMQAMAAEAKQLGVLTSKSVQIKN